MVIFAYLQAVVIGLAIAAPVGPIGVLCIRRTLADGRWTGFISGLGAATADATYGGIAAFGLTAVSGLLINQQHWLRLIGGIFLCYVGVHTALTRSSTATSASASPRSWLGAYSSTLALTITNPLTILSFAAIFAGLGLGSAHGNPVVAFATLVGVFTGSALWWLTLSTVVSLMRSRVTPASMNWINRVSGAVILTFGLIALASLLQFRYIMHPILNGTSTPS